MGFPFEIITMLGSTVLSGVMSIWAESRKAKAEEQKLLISRGEFEMKAVAAARNVENVGFQWTRRIIALTAVFFIIGWPKLVPVFFDTSVYLTWTEFTRGFLFLIEQKEITMDKEFFGVVSKIEPLARVEQNVTTFPVLIDINNDDNLLLLGMNTDVVIEILNEQVSMSIPSMSLRTRKDIIERVSELSNDIVNNQLQENDVKLLQNLLKISCSLVDAPKNIKKLTYSHDYLKKAAILLENRLDNLSELGINVKQIDFEVSFGRTSMEYYDGFVFEMGPKKQINSIPFAQGGRYNELTKILSRLQGYHKSTNSVGGIIRPEILHNFKLNQGIK